MRKSFIIFFSLALLISCNSQLVINSVQSENISNNPSGYLPDSSIIRLVGPYKSELDEDMSRVISITTDAMFKKKPESSLTNYLSDLLLKEGADYCRKQNLGFKPQIAYVNYGGIRSSLPEGEVTVGNIFELMPFENELVIVELAGSDLHLFADEVADRGGDGVAGITLGIKEGKVALFEVNGKKTVENQSYFLVTNDYVASGGGGMEAFNNKKKYIKTGLKIRDLIISSMEQSYQNGVKISSQEDGRIYYAK